MKQPAIYIMANKRNGTLYTGVTSNLEKRNYEHKNNLIPGFSSKYVCKILVYYEIHETMESAIFREKQLKSGSRNKKLKLIESSNPEWKDLSLDWIASAAPRNDEVA
jgi:putative endonuclease